MALTASRPPSLVGARMSCLVPCLCCLPPGAGRPRSSGFGRPSRLRRRSPTASSSRALDEGGSPIPGDPRLQGLARARAVGGRRGIWAPAQNRVRDYGGLPVRPARDRPRLYNYAWVGLPAGLGACGATWRRGTATFAAGLDRGGSARIETEDLGAGPPRRAHPCRARA